MTQAHGERRPHPMRASLRGHEVARPGGPPPLDAWAAVPVIAQPARGPACACGGTCPSCRVQTKPAVSTPADPHEQEADRVADAILRMPEPGVHAAPRAPEGHTGGAQPHDMPAGRTATPEPKLAFKRSAPQRKAAAPGASADSAFMPTPGEPLAPGEREFFEPRFGIDFSNVRIHHGAQAAALASEYAARAFTFGRDVVFGDGEYRPGTHQGRQLLAHELTHVAQQRRGSAALRGTLGISPRLQPSIMRVITHSGTATNCHNWTIPLPPWIAGSLAHRQLQAYFTATPGTAGAMRPEMPIPRATKAAGLMVGVPNPPFLTPPGFADLWAMNPGGIQIGEIKSTYQGGGVATREAAHYVLRHTEWLGRVPATYPDDTLYQTLQGGLRLPGVLMNGLAAVTGTGVSVGPFIGDPLKTLWAEADTSGAVCYWCIGAGIVNPVWLLVFLPLIQRMLDMFRAALHAAEEALQWIGDRIGDVVEWGREHPILAFIILLALVIIGYVLAILFGLLEAPTLGADTPLTIGSFATGTAALIALLALLGIEGGDLEPAINETAAFVYPQEESSGSLAADYERDTADGAWRSATAPAGRAPPAARLVAALTPIRAQIVDKITAAIDPFAPAPAIQASPANVARLNEAAQVLARSPHPELQSIGARVRQISGGVWA